MKTLTNYSKILFSFTALMAQGCGSAEMQRQIRTLEAGLSDLRSFQAEQTSKISTLESNLREVSGRVEQIEFSQHRQIGTDLTEIRKDLATIQKRIPPPPIVPSDILDRDEDRITEMPGELGRSFGDALAKIRLGQYQDASSALQEAQALSEGTRWYDDVVFWVGVVGDGLGDNRAALEAYHRLVSRSPKSEKAPIGLLRQASVLIRLGDSKAGALTLKKLISDYPRSTEAARAKEKLRDLGR